MALEVEDGTGKSDADAFVSVDDCSTYCTDRGLTAWTSVASSPAAQKEAAIRRATAYLTSAFTWKGSKLNGREQAQAWPRTGATDGEGDDVASDAVPIEVVQACCEIAAREIVTPGITSPDVSLAKRVKRAKAGSVEVEYASVPANAEAARPVLLMVLDLIDGLLATTSSSLSGAGLRA